MKRSRNGSGNNNPNETKKSSGNKNPSKSNNAVPLSAHRNDPRASNVLSVLAKAHAAGRGIFGGHFTAKELAVLRGLSTGFREAVGLVPIKDLRTIVKGSLKDWRTSFPNARAINISGRHDLTDDHFVHLEGLTTVIMDRCTGITDTAFVHLKGVKHLDMSFCSQAGITDAAFSHLKGIKTLNMAYCIQDSITDTAFSHLKGIHSLSMAYCTQASITDSAFSHLKGINTLVMNGCRQITDAAFVNLKGIHTLSMQYCNQEGITDAAFSHLKGVKDLDITGCNQLGITSSGTLCYLQQEIVSFYGKELDCPAIKPQGGTRKYRSQRRKSTKKGLRK